MGENFTGVKNEILTRITAVFLAAVAVTAAAGLALIQPAELAPALNAKGAGPAILYTGPNVLFRSKHIPGSVYAGPGSSPAGLAILKQEAGKLPRDREIVIYCGCCPWDRCPNIQPAVDVLKEMGFTKVKALYLGTGFKVDWIDKGYPVE
jgi:thiosulfate/3-mercaptopyruvate sulfurtransferase